MMEIKDAGKNHKALRMIARALIDKAASGDVPAINALSDRTDGKVAQAIVGEEDNPIKVIHKIERVIIYPKDRNSGDI